MQSTLSRTRKSAAFGHVFSRAPCAQIRSSFTPQPPKIKFLIFCCWDEWRAWVTRPECGRHEGQCQEPRKGLQLEVGAPRLLVGTYILYQGYCCFTHLASFYCKAKAVCPDQESFLCLGGNQDLNWRHLVFSLFGKLLHHHIVGQDLIILFKLVMRNMIMARLDMMARVYHFLLHHHHHNHYDRDNDLLHNCWSFFTGSVCGRLGGSWNRRWELPPSLTWAPSSSSSSSSSYQ